MKRFVLAAIVLSTFLLPVKATAGLDYSKVSWQVTELDDLRFRADSLRIHYRPEEAVEAVRNILKAAPGDGFALMQYCQIAREVGTMADISEVLAAGETPPGLEGIELSDAEFDLLYGILEFYRYRYRSSLEKSQSALEKRPGWGFAKVFIARASENLLMPIDQWEPLLQEALSDPKSATAVFQYIMGRYPPHYLASDIKPAEKALRKLDTVRLLEQFVIFRMATDEILDQPQKNPEECASQWLDLRAKCPERLIDSCNYTAWILARGLPPKGYAEFIDLIAAEGSEKRQLALSSASRLMVEDDKEGTLEILSELGDSSSFALESMQYAVSLHGPASTLRYLIIKALDEESTRNMISSSRWAAEQLSDDEIGRMVEAARYQNPVADMKIRLDRLLETNFSTAAARIDSLENVGVEMRNLTDLRLNSWERLELTEKTDKLLKSLPRLTRFYYGGDAFDGAAASGRRDRAVELIKERRELFPSSPLYLNILLDESLKIGDRELISELIDDLLAVCPDCPYVLEACSSALIWLKRPEEALTLIRRANSADDPPSVSVATTLAQHAQSLEEPELADSLMETARLKMPESKIVAISTGWILASRGKTGEAREIYQKISAEYPGDEYLRSMIVSTGGAAASIASSMDSELASAFNVFDYDFESIDSILAAAETADTMSGALAVYLQKRISVVAEGKERSIKRSRETVLIRNEGILQFYQPFHIEFDASDAVPVVRLARVIQRDGTVQDVDLADILITSSPSEHTDIDDSRAVAIPLPGLKEGSILDIVYDEETKSWYSVGWSTRLFVPGVFPVLESIVEISSSPGLELECRGVGELPEPVETETAGRRLLAWRMTDLEAITIEDFAPNIFELYPWVGVSTHQSVETGVELYRQDFWSTIDASAPEVKELAGKLTEGQKGDRAKVEAILKHVVESVQYVAIELGSGRFLPSKPEEVFQRGYGDCKDMVALMVSLFEAVGIEAEPVLVSDREGFKPVDGLAEPFIYRHVIVHTPGVDNLYIDPTAGSPCLSYLPISLSGAPGIVVPRKDRIRMVTLPETDYSQHGITIEADLMPTPANRARFDITCRYRGFMALVGRAGIAYPDTVDQNAFIRGSLGHGLWNTCILKGWEQVSDDCEELVLKAVFIDTSWVNGQMNSITFNWKSEVADPIVMYPSPKNRKHPFLIPFPFESEVILRFHNTMEWVADPIMPVSVKGDGYEGSISSKTGEKDDSLVEVHQKFRMDKNYLELEEYKKFRHDWIHMLGGVYQNYQYRRLLDKEALKKINEYVEKNPEDAGFAFQAAMNIVGNDAGGQGESGRERRIAARTLLQPLMADPETAAWPAMLLAAVEMNDGRYIAADSLITISIEAEPSNSYAMAIALGLKSALGDLDGSIELHRQLLRMVGNAPVERSLIGVLHQAQRYEEAEEAIDRYYLLHGRQDSTQINIARFTTTMEAQRCEEADSIYAAIKDQINPDELDFYEGQLHLSCNRFEEASVSLDKIWENNPFNSFICNNLAWCLVLIGRDLPRAEEMAELSILLSTDKTAPKNTLGAIYARRGEWDRARKIFVELYEGDDRPAHRAANDFFIGLCDYYTGDEKEGLERWRKIIELDQASPDANGWAKTALELHSKNEPVKRAIFIESEEEK